MYFLPGQLVAVRCRDPPKAPHSPGVPPQEDFLPFPSAVQGEGRCLKFFAYNLFPGVEKNHYNSGSSPSSKDLSIFSILQIKQEENNCWRIWIWSESDTSQVQHWGWESLLGSSRVPRMVRRVCTHSHQSLGRQGLSPRALGGCGIPEGAPPPPAARATSSIWKGMRTASTSQHLSEAVTTWCDGA